MLPVTEKQGCFPGKTCERVTLKQGNNVAMLSNAVVLVKVTKEQETNNIKSEMQFTLCSVVSLVFF